MSNEQKIELECFDEMSKNVLSKVKEAIDFAEKMNLMNSQNFLNFLDTLNEYSVKY